MSDASARDFYQSVRDSNPVDEWRVGPVTYPVDLPADWDVIAVTFGARVFAHNMRHSQQP